MSKPATRPSQVVELRGHILDSGLLQKVFDEIMSRGADHEIVRFDVGRRHEDTSYAALRVETETEADLVSLVERLQSYGANPATDEDAVFEAAEADGVLPDGFYCTTNLPTRIRVDGRWLDVANPEMDCAILVDPDTGSARTVPMDDVRRGDLIVCGVDGVKVTPRQKPRQDSTDAALEVAHAVTPQKPHALMAEQVAQTMRDVKASGAKLLWVAGPALVYTGAVEPTCALIRAGYMDVLFAGNQLASHDIEGNLFGTSLGVPLSHDVHAERGHEHQIRAINQVRRAGGIRAAVEDGTITGGIMWHCVRYGVDVVLAGSVRDDGPLPDVIRDSIEAQAQMRRRIPDVGFVLMAATLLHSVATVNMLPAHVPQVCLDINAGSVGKVVEHGSDSSVGIVTDVGLFVRELAQLLAADELRQIRNEGTTSGSARPGGEATTA